jgi:monofunctional chorismate mutase
MREDTASQAQAELTKIDDWRSEIDNIDNELLQLLNRRAKFAARIGELKQAAGLPLLDEDRERALLSRLCRVNAGPLDKPAIARIFLRIIREIRRMETTKGAR